jgi:hypothetical protein
MRANTRSICPIVRASRYETEQPEIHTPAVHAQARDRLTVIRGDPGRRRQARHDSGEDVRGVPAQAAPARGEGVREAVRLLEEQVVRTEAAHDDAPAARAEIDGDVEGGRHVHGWILSSNER